jgi:hypothetical protein
MTDKPENPQAFPHGNPTYGGATGMTIRDYFAGQIIAGLGAPVVTHGRYKGTWTYDGEEVAASAYRMADLMLKERSK